MHVLSEAEATRQISELLERVRHGESFLVKAHGKAAVEIRPSSVLIDEERAAARKALFERLDRQPTLNLPRWTRDELYDD